MSEEKSLISGSGLDPENELFRWIDENFVSPEEAEKFKGVLTCLIESYGEDLSHLTYRIYETAVQSDAGPERAMALRFYLPEEETIAWAFLLNDDDHVTNVFTLHQPEEQSQSRH